MPSPNDLFGYVMPSGLNAFSNSLHRKLGTLQPEKHQLKSIASVAQPLNPSGIVLRRQRGLESEGPSLLARSCKRFNITRPACNATLAGSKPERPSAIGSAFTYSSTPN